MALRLIVAAKLASVDFTGSDLSAATFSSETQFSDGYIGVNLNETTDWYY